MNHGVTVIPVSAFYRQPDAPESNHRIVRFCFAKKDATLDAALERLCLGVVQTLQQFERARQMARSFIFTNTSKYCY